MSGTGADHERSSTVLRASDATARAKLYVVRSSYLLSPERTVILHNPKCASTSLLAAYLTLEGHDVEMLLDQSDHPEVQWDQGVWAYRHLLSGLLENRPAGETEGVLASTTHRKLAFVREPMGRIWSAWVSKILVGEPAYAHIRDRLMGTPVTKSWSMTTTESELARAFAEFVEILAQGDTLLSDPHFMPQSTLLEDLVEASIVHDVSDVHTAIERYAPRLGARLGHPRNASPMTNPHPICSRSTYAVIRDLYQSDFDRFGSLWEEGYDERWSSLLTSLKPVGELLIFRIQAARRLARVVEHGDSASIGGRQAMRVLADSIVRRSRLVR